MHIYYLISPDSITLHHNPGVALISFGTRHLIKQADPEAIFIPISNLRYKPDEWHMLYKHCQCLILAGGSLFDSSDTCVFWNDGVFRLIASAQARGIHFADLFGYANASIPLKPLPSLVSSMASQPRNKRVLSVHKKAALVITREILSQSISLTVRDDVYCLPCSSFFSPNYFGISPGNRLYNIISVFPTTTDKWFAVSLMNIYQHLSKEKPTYFICNSLQDYRWFTSFFPNAPNILCIYDPKSLLDLYSHCDKVVSAKLHTAIPAFSLGCRVIYISYDSRFMALDPFKIPHIPFTELRHLSIPFKYSSRPAIYSPDPEPFINLFREKIVSRF